MENVHCGVIYRHSTVFSKNNKQGLVVITYFNLLSKLNSPHFWCVDWVVSLNSGL